MGIIRLDICNLIAAVEIPNRLTFYKTIQSRYRKFHCLPDVKHEDIFLSLQVKPFGNNYKPGISSFNKGWNIRGQGFDCMMSCDNGRFRVTGCVWGSIYSFDTLLRLVLLQALSLKNGFLVHACGLGIGNNGYLLPGASGRGKTTLARKSPQSSILSDELVCVRLIKGKPMILSTPFWGEFRAPSKPFGKPLRRIYFLHKGSRLKVTELSKGDAIKTMLKLILFFSDATESTESLLKTARQCIMKIPCYNIWLAKKSSYESIKRVISGE
jgi:hypothetical protein